MYLVKKIDKKNLEKGLTLIEASMVLALSAVVIAGAVMYYNSASESNKTQRAQSLLGGIQAGVQSIYATRPNFKGLVTTSLTSTSSIPRAFIEAGTNTIVNPWGGNVVIASIEPFRTYTVSYIGIPKAVCGPLASADLGNSLISVSVAPNASLTSQTAAMGPAITPGSNSFTSDTVAACNDGDNDSLLDISWTFK